MRKATKILIFCHILLMYGTRLSQARPYALDMDYNTHLGQISKSLTGVLPCDPSFQKEALEQLSIPIENLKNKVLLPQIKNFAEALKAQSLAAKQNNPSYNYLALDNDSLNKTLDNVAHQGLYKDFVGQAFDLEQNKVIQAYWQRSKSPETLYELNQSVTLKESSDPSEKLTEPEAAYSKIFFQTGSIKQKQGLWIKTYTHLWPSSQDVIIDFLIDPSTFEVSSTPVALRVPYCTEQALPEVSQKTNKVQRLRSPALDPRSTPRSNVKDAK